MELSVYDQLVVLALDAHVFDRSIFDRSIVGGENVFIQNLGQRLAAYGNLRRCQVKRERICVIKDNDRSGFCWSEISAQLNDVRGNPAVEVAHDVFHLGLNRVRIRWRATSE